MSNQKQEQKKGVIRRSVGWYVGAVGRGAKGAVGVETFRQVGGMLDSAVSAARSAKDSLRYQQCPRCREQSLIEQENKFQCARIDMCGFEAASIEEVGAFRQQMQGVDGRVLALAKGSQGGFRKRANGAVTLSRLSWAMSALLLIYGLSWVFDGVFVYALWVGLVAIFMTLQAVKYAYAAHRLTNGDGVTPLAFLTRPSMWFPARQS